jgi:hypothetical protein
MIVTTGLLCFLVWHISSSSLDVTPIKDLISNIKLGAVTQIVLGMLHDYLINKLADHESKVSHVLDIDASKTK